MPVTDQPVLTFGADVAHLATVRDFACDRAVELGAHVDLGVLAVIVGELAANAAIHAGGQARLEMELDDEGVLEVSVSDPSPLPPHLIEDEPWSAEGHRGIQLVAALAHSWGVEGQLVGKRVWARIAPTPAPAG